MKLTKDERHTAYVILLAELEKSDTHIRAEKMLCHLIYAHFGISDRGIEDNWKGEWFWEAGSGFNIGGVFMYFPELMDKYHGWPRADFQEGFDHRISVLKQCIEETADF